jgi:hypothetical protein
MTPILAVKLLGLLMGLLCFAAGTIGHFHARWFGFGIYRATGEIIPDVAGEHIGIAMATFGACLLTWAVVV